MARTGRRLLPPSAGAALAWLAIAAIWIWLFAPLLVRHVRLGADPGHFDGDARQQIAPFFRYEDPAVFAGDLATDYYLACLPLGYKGIYFTAAQVASVRGLSFVLPYLLTAVTLAALGLAVHRFSGRIGVLAAVIFGLSSPFFLARATSGLPRGFGFPIAACALAALAWGRPRALAAVVVAGALFYPAAAAPAGLALAAWLLLLPARDRGEAAGWSLRRRLAWVGGTAAVSALLLLPPVIAASSYGAVIGPADLGEFPEAGPGGRYMPGDRGPFPGFAHEAKRRLEHRLPGMGPPIFPPLGGLRRDDPAVFEGTWWGLFGVAAAGWLLLCLRRSDARRATVLLAAAVVGYHLAALFAPRLYLPQRYALYPVVPLAILALTAGPAGFLPGARGWLGRRAPPEVPDRAVEDDRPAGRAPGPPPQRTRAERLRPWAVGLYCALVLAPFGNRGSAYAGFSVRLDEEAPVYRFLGTLPVDSLIAGWPRGPVENVPYLTRRPVLVSFEIHQAFHRRYTLEMRDRTEALIDAYLATGPAPLERLRDEHGVSHLLVDRAELEALDLSYFRPFDEQVRSAIDAANGERLEVLRQAGPAAAFDDGRLFVLDLSRLAD